MTQPTITCTCPKHPELSTTMTGSEEGKYWNITDQEIYMCNVLGCDEKFIWPQYIVDGGRWMKLIKDGIKILVRMN